MPRTRKNTFSKTERLRRERLTGTPEVQAAIQRQRLKLLGNAGALADRLRNRT